MKKRIKLRTKPYINIKLKDKILLISLLIIFSSYSLSYYFDKVARNGAIALATNESKLLGEYIINKVINEFNSTFGADEEFWTETRDKEGNIISIDFNTKNVNKSLSEINKNILINLRKLERGDHTYLNTEVGFKYNITKGNAILYIPFGRISNNMFFNILGPEIPLRLYAVGNIISNIKTTIKEYGINNVLFQMSIEVKLTEKIILPFLSDEVVIKSDIPVIIKLIEGKIPEFYGGFITNTSPTNSLNVK